MEEPDINIATSASVDRKKKITGWVNIAIMAAAIILAILVYNWRKPKEPVAEKGMIIKAHADSNVNEQKQPVKGK